MYFDAFPFAVFIFYDKCGARRTTEFCISQEMACKFCCYCSKLYFYDSVEFENAYDFCIQANVGVEIFKIKEIQKDHVIYSFCYGNKL